MNNLRRAINLSVRFHKLDKSNYFSLNGIILKAVNSAPKKHKEMCEFFNQNKKIVEKNQ